MITHSTTMEVTKRIEETIKDNFTSSQIATTLDDLIFRAISPLITQTVYVDRVLASLLSWLGAPKRRYISHLPKATLIRYIIIFLASTDQKERVDLYQKMRFERGLHFSILNHFLVVSEGYMKNVVTDLKSPLCKKLVSNTNSIVTQLGVTGDLWVVHQEASAWFKYAVEFRNLVIEKYMRHAVNHAVFIYQRFNYMDKDDLIQNLLLSVNRAINKYDSSKGTLTTYINLWFKDTRKVSVDYNKCVHSPKHVSYDELMEYQQHDDLEFISHLNAEVIEEKDEDNTDVTFVRHMAKYADPHGFARLELGIGEILNEIELQTLSLSLC